MFPQANRYGTVWDQEAIYKIVNSSLEGTSFPFIHPEGPEVNGVTHLYLRQVAYFLFRQRDGKNFPNDFFARTTVDHGVTESRYKQETEELIKVPLLDILQDYLVEKGVMDRREASKFIDTTFSTIYKLIAERAMSKEELKEKKKTESRNKAAAKRKRQKIDDRSVGGGSTGSTTKTHGGDEGYGGPPYRKWHPRKRGTRL